LFRFQEFQLLPLFLSGHVVRRAKDILAAANVLNNLVILEILVDVFLQPEGKSNKICMPTVTLCLHTDHC